MAKLLPLLLALGMVVIATATKRYRVPHNGGDFPPIAHFAEEPHHQRLRRQPVHADIGAALHPGHHEHPEYPREPVYNPKRLHLRHREARHPHVPHVKPYNQPNISNYRRYRVPHNQPHDIEHHHVEVQPVARPHRLGFDPSYGRRPKYHYYD